MVRITLRMPPAISEGVTKIASLENKSQNQVIVEACESLISRYKQAERKEEPKDQ